MLKKQRAGRQHSLTRRQFLRDSVTTGTAAMLGPTIAPGSVFGAEAPSNRITVGMIGMGRQAYHSNLKTLLGFGDVQVVAVNDVDRWRLENAKNAVQKYYANKQASGAFEGCSALRDFP